MRMDDTHEDSRRAPELSAPEVPGLVVLFAAGKPASGALSVGTSEVDLGRSSSIAALSEDDRVSRRHVLVSRRGNKWCFEDLETRNGTFVNGKRLVASTTVPSPAVLRIGKSVLWAVDDVSPFLSSERIPVVSEGPIVGGKLRRAWGEIALASRAGDTLLIRGESGSGKELGARAFHEADASSGAASPFVAVNCAAIPEGLAERLLFGARRGAYSGATTDAEGYVQAAHRGTLFLDEIAELDLLVQAKLLRVVETREVMPLGASRPQSVQIRICTATHKNLREEVTAGRFREDLYFRIGRPEVTIPPLRERLDEVPRFVMRELMAVHPDLVASVTLIEACALRAWPGNVRELVGEIRRAGHRAHEEGSEVVYPDHLASDAGLALNAGKMESEPPQIQLSQFGDDAIAQALLDHGGNVRGAARALGMHRNQLRRWLEKHPDVRVRMAES
jgi:transcriptional regulator with GAF, ATPase, and Fis domain